MTKRLLSLFACLMLFGSAYSQNVNVSSIDTIANCFSPNNDGINDVFQVNGAGFTDFKLCIYDRWGTIVYNFISANDAWDGYNTTGEPCSNGTYFFFLIGTGVDGKSYNEKGTIELFR